MRHNCKATENISVYGKTYRKGQFVPAPLSFDFDIMPSVVPKKVVQRQEAVRRERDWSGRVTAFQRPRGESRARFVVIQKASE